MRRLLALTLIFAALAARAGGPVLVLDARVTWREAAPEFGGYSALAVADGGQSFLAISDRGTWARGSFERQGGRLAAAHLAALGALHARSGAPLGGDDFDAEGAAVDAAGRVYVSFEAFHRVRRYADIDGPAAAVPSHPDFARLQPNSGLEALASGPDGTLYAIPERSGAWERPFPVYRLRAGRWDTSLKLRRDGTFLVVDADFGPEGALYVLERDFRWLGGFATRIRRFTLGPDRLDGEVTLLRTAFGELDNMEGISVWRDGAGRTRVTLISDDNFFPLQQTIFAEYLLQGS
jgi:hypothetical protein